jgi:hypothetical protein
VTDTEIVPNPARIIGRVGARLTIPTHVTPAGGQTTHPSVLFVEDGWNGYRYWMAHTPYPGGNDDHEDPNICASHDGIVWEVPAGLTNPIDDQTGQPALNSDVDLKFGPGDTLFLFWRTYDVNATGTEEQLYFSTSADGVTWAPKQLFYHSDDNVLRLLSPSLVFDGDRWVMWAVDMVPSPNRVVRLVSATADPMSTWSAPVTVPVGAMQSGKEPWHIYVTRHDGQFVGLLADCTTGASGLAGDLLFLQSLNGLSFTNSGKPVIPRAQAGEHEQLYRSTLVPAVQDGVHGYRVWYTGWRTGPPSVWNLYRTWIGAPVTVSGSLHPPATIPAGGFTSIPVSFPAGSFTAPPYVTVTTDSARLTLGTTNITTTGFDLLAQNWSPGPAGTAAWFRWGAHPLP